MAATLVGEAAIRIVPSLKGFKPEADRRLKEMRFEPIRVKIEPRLAEADAEMDAWRARQELNAVRVPVRTDFAAFQRDLSQVEHIFKKSSLSNAIRLNVKVIGLDALPALAYAAGSAASGLDALAESALVLPGILGGVGASVGALLIGLRGVSDTLKAYATDTKDAAQGAIKQQDANRALARSYQDYKGAVRDTIREIQDLNTENRRSSLNVADALLSVQEARERLAKGGFSSVTEYQRAQLGLAESIEHVQDVMTKAQRTTEDTTEANRKGVAGADKVVDALQAIAANTAKLDESKVSEVGKAMAKLSPNAKSAVEAIHSFSGAWTHLQQSVQDNLFSGIDQSIKDLGQRTLPGLEIGLSRVASGLNKNFKSVAESLGNEKSGTFLQRIFGNTDEALTRLSRGMNPLIDSFLHLSQASSNFLPRIADGFDKVFTRFDHFIDKVDGDGSLNRWIDSGLRALDSLGNATIQISSIVSSVSKAFDEASGHSGGFIKTLDDSTKKWAEFLKGDKGQGDLVTYFKQAKEFIGEIKGALHEMRPFLKEIVESVREWSGGLLEVVGALAETADWIDRNTGLLKVFVDSYLVIRTVKPVIEGLTGAWKNYSTVLAAAAKNSVFGNIPGIQAAASGMNTFKTGTIDTVKQMEKLHKQFPTLSQVASNVVPPLNNTATAALGASTKLKGLSDETRAAMGKFPALQQVATNVQPVLNGVAAQAGGASSKVKNLGEEAGKAGAKIGEGKASMLSRVGALGIALGPAAALMIGVPLVMAAIDKLGEAHKRAADDADRQKQSLDRLKDSIDQVTGAAGKAALAQLGKTNQQFAVPGLGDRNLYNDAATLGIGSQQLLTAQNPINTTQHNDVQAKLNAETKSRIAGSSEWREYHEVWERSGVDLDTIALAANGDPDALGKVNAAEKRMFNGGTRQQAQGGLGLLERQRIAEGNAAPDLTSLIKSASAYEPVSVSLGLRHGEETLRESGLQAVQANDALNGRGRFKDPVASQFFGQYGASDANVHINDSGQAEIITNSKPDIAEADGTVVQDGQQFKVTLTEDGTNKYIQKFADGGMVRGPGGPRDDKVLVRTSPGEHVTNADAVRYYGVGLFNALNSKSVPHASTGAWFGNNIPLDPILPPPPPIPPQPTVGWSPAPGVGGGLPGALTPPPMVPGLVPGLLSGPNAGSPLLPPASAPPFVPGLSGPQGLTNDGPASLTPPPNASGLFGGALQGTLGSDGLLLPSPTSPIAVPGLTDAQGTPHWTPTAPNPNGGPRTGPLQTGPFTPAPIAPPLTSGAATAHDPILQREFDSYKKSRDDWNRLYPGEQSSNAGMDDLWRARGFDPNEPAGGATTGPTGTHPDAPQGKVGYWYFGKWITGADGKPPEGAFAPGGALAPPAGTVPGGAGAPPPLTNIPHTTHIPSANAPQVPIGRTPAYALTTGPDGQPVVAPNGPVMARLSSMLQGLVGTPYTGSFSPAGLDCSGLASLVSNTVSGRDPWGGGRFTTHNELQELTARGFIPGKGPPGTVTIGWNDDHTAITLPDGTNVSSGETGGFAYGGGGANQSQFTNWMYMPVDSDALAGLSGVLPGGKGLPGSGAAGLGLTGPGGRAPGLAGLPDNLKPGKILGAFGSVLVQGLAGAFGIDTSYLGDIDQVANFGLSKLFGGAGQDPNLTGLAGEALQDGENGQPGVSSQLAAGLGSVGFGGAGSGGGANGPLNLTGTGAPTGADIPGPDGAGGPAAAGGKELTQEQINAQYGSLIAQICQSMGVDPAKWAGPLEKQIFTESKGNVKSLSSHGDVGLFNFKPGTFAANKVPGIGSGSINDPASQIAAAIHYVMTKPGYTSQDGTPVGIGNGLGFATGGYPDGLAYLSAGEYRSSPSTTATYGSSLFNALNSKSIPRSAAAGMARGGFPFGLPRFDTGGPVHVPGLDNSSIAPPDTGGTVPTGPPLPIPAPVGSALGGIGATIGSALGGLDSVSSWATDHDPDPTGLLSMSAPFSMYNSLRTVGSWGQHSGLDQAAAVANLASVVPIPGLRFAGRGIGAADSVARDAAAGEHALSGLDQTAAPPISLSRNPAYTNHNIPLDPNNFYRGIDVPEFDAQSGIGALFADGAMQGRWSGWTDGQLSFSPGSPLEQYINGMVKSNLIIEGDGRMGVDIPKITGTPGASRNAIRGGYGFVNQLNLADVMSGKTPIRVWQRQALDSGVPADQVNQWSKIFDSFEGHATGGMLSGPGSGTSDSMLARVSNGEFITRASVAARNPALYHALNSGAIDPANVPGFWGGGFMPTDIMHPADPSGETAGPLSLGTAAPPAPEAAAPPGPDMAPNDPPPQPGGMPGGPSLAPPPGTGGTPGPGATAPAPDPGTLPGVSDALAAIGGAGGGIGGGGGGGMPQPGADPGSGADPRATLGAAPVSNDHNLPALSKGIQGAAQAAGNAGAMAAAVGSMGMGGGAAGSMISAGAQMGGQIATSAVNILSSLLVGTATGGSTGSASGVPMLPQRQPMQAGGVQPIVQRAHYGDINVTNLDEYKRTQERMDAQDSMPFIGKY